MGRGQIVARDHKVVLGFLDGTPKRCQGSKRIIDPRPENRPCPERRVSTGTDNLNATARVGELYRKPRRQRPTARRGQQNSGNPDWELRADSMRKVEGCGSAFAVLKDVNF
jgi:hypothetical protein